MAVGIMEEARSSEECLCSNEIIIIRYADMLNVDCSVGIYIFTCLRGEMCRLLIAPMWHREFELCAA
jgi:hypothetical protein